MNLKRVYEMKVKTVYPLYVAKVERKGKTKEEVNQVISWLTAYEEAEIESVMMGELSFEDFFKTAPKLNPNRKLIKGVICGVRVEEIEDEIMQEVRYLDKLIDELARGKKIENILRK